MCRLKRRSLRLLGWCGGASRFPPLPASWPGGALCVLCSRWMPEPSSRLLAFADRLAEAVEQKRSQLVVGLDPRLDLLPLELRGDAQVGRPAAAEATARFCCGIVDAVAPHVVAVKPQLAFFEVLGERRHRRIRARGRLRARCRPARDRRREARGHRIDRARVCRRLSRAGRGPRAGRRCPHRQHLPRARLARAVRRRLPAGGGGLFCLVKTSNAGSARRPGPRALGRSPRSGSRLRSSSRSSARSSSASAASPASAPSSARRTRRAIGEARRLLPAGDPAPARGRRPGQRHPGTSRVPSRAVRRARSSMRRARSSMRSGRGRRTGARRRGRGRPA